MLAVNEKNASFGTLEHMFQKSVYVHTSAVSVDVGTRFFLIFIYFYFFLDRKLTMTISAPLRWTLEHGLEKLALDWTLELEF